ncbi:hypothetical protein ELH21_09270 [Rhizobium leguminosarum]|uniref:hypothetical protein n=1 Tax=Rhizobium leguminosarum TaxID=384 RepID=UPI001030AE89|nr:hypothetical protein [Rhizobium leguminosarum]TBD04568.1 hypothetical protein ELH21_09270 [Rhizobium leguminosarum]
MAENAEAEFRTWLNRSGVAYISIKQAPVVAPGFLHGRITHPDYLVGVPHSGILAFAVKPAEIHDGHLIFEKDNIEKLSRFASLFKLTAYFACVDPGRDGHLWWVPMLDLLSGELEWRAEREVVTANLSKAYAIDTGQVSFLDAVLHYSSHVLESA